MYWTLWCGGRETGSRICKIKVIGIWASSGYLDYKGSRFFYFNEEQLTCSLLSPAAPEMHRESLTVLGNTELRWGVPNTSLITCNDFRIHAELMYN